MIWVISDTHLSRKQILPETFTNRVGREDIILHLGDIISLEALAQLRSLCRIEAVGGNCDMPDVRRGLPLKAVLEIKGWRIGMIHGKGGQQETVRMAMTEFADSVDIVLFGHTHVPYHRRENGILYFNPGSLRAGRGEGNTFGRLHLEDDKPWGELIQLVGP